MKSACGKVLALLVVSAGIVLAGPRDVEIIAAKTKLDEKRESSTSRTQVTQQLGYKVTVNNKTFKNIADLKIKYMIIFEDAADIGTGEGAAKKYETGEETIAVLESNKTFSFVTQPITITKEEMKPGWIAGGAKAGSSRDSTDRVRGVWFRAYVGDEMVGEYCNPTTVPNKNTWKDK